MKKEELKKSFDNIEPDNMTTQKMLRKILNHSAKMREVNYMKSVNIRKVIPALAIVLVITGGLLSYDLIFNKVNKETRNITEDSRMNESDLSFREPAVHDVKNQFQIENKHYILMPEAQKQEFQFPDTIDAKDIGDKITTIETSIDAGLLGSDVYEYIPAGGEAVVAVKKDDAYRLFRFLMFDSYIKNQDEDVRAYLELFGIKRAEDIAKIQFIGYSEQAKLEGRLDIISEITEPTEILEFYQYYSVMKNASDKYFDKLFNFVGYDYGGQAPASEQNDIPPDYIGRLPADSPENETGGIAVDLPESETDEGFVHFAEDLPLVVESGDSPTADDGSAVIIEKRETKAASGSTSIEGSAGSAAGALSNETAIRIYNQKGLYYEAMYYPNIGFISRHEVNDAFADFLKDAIKR